jgi:CheY-like chemotaxis protein
VSLTAAPADGRGWRLRFAVRDTGIGVPPDRLDRLFRMFSQVDASHTRTHGGTGLGLAIARRLVERMNGRIWVDSAPGQGSTFSFEVELGVAPDQAAAIDRIDFKGRRLLLVDDNATNRRVLRLMLESWGCAVDEAAEPLEGLRLAAQGRYDAAILDFNMPRMTGLELAQALRAMPGTQQLPLLLLGSTGEAPSEADRALFTARLLKPVRQSTLFDQLAGLFGVAYRSGADKSASARALAVPEPQSVRVLVAEDNSVNQKVALRFLDRLGYSADVVGNGAEAVEACLRQAYDIVLMDVQMPEMDGFEATREIRKHLASGPRIIAVTANALEGDEQRCLDAGMDDYIRKPMELKELSAALSRARRP